MLTPVIALMLSILPGYVQDKPAIAVQRQGDNMFQLTVTLPGVSDPTEAQTYLAPRAGELCGALPARFDRYRFSATAVTPGQTPLPTAIDSLTLVQDIHCGGDPAVTVTPSYLAPPPPLTEADAERLRPGIETLTNRYFAALDEGRDIESHSMASAAMTGGASVEEWAMDRATRRQATGAYVSRTVVQITWYSNPSGVEPGYYAAVDFVAAWERQDECGYLVWHSPDGVAPFLLARQETTLLPHELEADTLAGLRKQYCILL
jgi:hypothetical protein